MAAALLALLGVGLVLTGAALIYVPAAFVLGGLIALVAARAAVLEVKADAPERSDP